MEVMSTHKNGKWTDPPTTQHVHSHLMRRCCMGAHAGPAGISSFHTVVTADFTAQWAIVAHGNWLPQLGLTS